ncbi:unnamed protein product [Didymodactylos carnosus]|uniref:Caveolin n=1 Tax=Didymodactylos carnosus TaxID=1234261 RepID=A0A815BEX4_9BILA|nr:unnamed protein product [Didymodactylos carnosus]CAF1269711.1 unnamed protein product [Didymodactylos carnosus]CAF3978093.1 unnamed protein product [Didymodactylos carnosus]CAF4056459.1 unnamed protein product [Didymodactylos carnosus]
MSAEYLIKAPPQMDTNQRDPHGINKHLQLDWQNVFCEPDPSSHNFSVLWSVSYFTYYYTKLCMYRLLVTLIGIPLVFAWALIFAVYTFFMIYWVAPSRRLFQSLILETGIYINDICSAFIGPVFRAIGQQFSDIRVKLSNEQIQIARQIQV